MEEASNSNGLDSPQRRAVVRHVRRLWKNGRVPYVFHRSLGAEHDYLKCSAQCTQFITNLSATIFQKYMYALSTLLYYRFFGKGGYQ